MLHRTSWMVVVVCALMVGAAQAQWTWTTILSEDFTSDPAGSWNYSGVQNAGSQNLFRWNSSGRVDAEWDQTNSFAYGDPFQIVPSRLSCTLDRTLTDQDTFKVGATIQIQSVASTTEFFQVANFGLYNLVEMGSDRAMSDNFSGNSTLVKDGSDFVEWNYFIQNESWGWNPYTGGAIGAHIAGTEGEYTVGATGDALFHQTDMGAGNYLPTNTDLYVEVKYFGNATGSERRRVYSAVYTDSDHTQILSVAGVEQFYWTQALPDEKSFTLTDIAFFNYPAANWGGANGTGSGSYDDAYVAVGVPEPGSLYLVGVVLMQLLRRRRKGK